MTTDFGAWVRHVRTQQGLTLKQAGDKTGIRWQVLQRWETGLNKPRSASIRLFCEQMGQSYEAALAHVQTPEPFSVDPDKPVTIYALVDPDTQLVRYVGMTTIDPQKRLAQHVGGAQPSRALGPKDRWLLDLKSRKLRPEVRVLERVSLEECREAERRWLTHYNQHGAPLTNNAEGGAMGRPIGEDDIVSTGQTVTIRHPARNASLTLERSGDTITIKAVIKAVQQTWTLDYATFLLLINT